MDVIRLFIVIAIDSTGINLQPRRMDKSQIECQERLSKIHVAIDIKKK